MKTTDFGPNVAWLEARVNAARAISPDALLIAVTVAILLFMMLFIAWWKASRRARAATKALARLEEDLAGVRLSLEEEVKWRLASDKIGARQATFTPE